MDILLSELDGSWHVEIKNIYIICIRFSAPSLHCALPHFVIFWFFVLTYKDPSTVSAILLKHTPGI